LVIEACAGVPEGIGRDSQQQAEWDKGGYIELGYFKLPPHLVKRYLEAKQNHIDTELDQLWQGVHRAQDHNCQEGRKVQHYALKARQLLRQLEDLEAQARLYWLFICLMPSCS
jgi:hypothetical protein